jgi:hypothetical protein
VQPASLTHIGNAGVCHTSTEDGRHPFELFVTACGSIALIYHDGWLDGHNVTYSHYQARTSSWAALFTQLKIFRGCLSVCFGMAANREAIRWLHDEVDGWVNHLTELNNATTGNAENDVQESMDQLKDLRKSFSDVETKMEVAFGERKRLVGQLQQLTQQESLDRSCKRQLATTINEIEQSINDKIQADALDKKPFGQTPARMHQVVQGASPAPPVSYMFPSRNCTGKFHIFRGAAASIESTHSII